MSNAPRPNQVLTASDCGMLRKGDLLRRKDGTVVTLNVDGLPDASLGETFIGRPGPDGWVPWSGGENPVPGQMVDYRTSDGDEYRDEAADDNDWSAGHISITAFRLASPAPAAAGGEVEAAGYCEKCGTARSKAPCFKCGGDLIQPAAGWDEPRLPDVEPIRAVARQHGYAIGVHGSLEADLDLIAAPWVEGACSPRELADHIAAAINGRVLNADVQDKPLGRWSCCIQIDGWFKTIDLSVAAALSAPPKPPEAEVLAGAVRDLLNEHDGSVCHHEDTKRGGVIWTICCDCNKKWADDEGGFVPYSDPPAVARARTILAALSQSGAREGEK